MIEFIDGEPPVTSGCAGSVQAIVDRLQATPGRWAIVFRAPIAAEGRAAQFLAGEKAAYLRKLGCEARSRTVRADGEARVYARWAT